MNKSAIGHFTAATIFFIITILLLTCGYAHGQKGRVGNDSTVKVYIRTFEQNSLYNNLDSLNSMTKFIGTAMTKDDWIQVITIYGRIIGRLATYGKLDSLNIKR